MAQLSRYNPSGSSILSSLTEAERAYFIACTDIFHDTQYNCLGRPSFSSQLQNCVVFNLTTNYSAADFGLPSTDIWDLNIFSLPFVTSQTMYSYVDNGVNLDVATTPVAGNWGGVTAIGVPNGEPCFWPASNTRTKSLNLNEVLFPNYLNTDTPIVKPYYQILSMGVEFINSTPELYRSGNVIRYRVPTQARTARFRPAASSFEPRETIYALPLPPSTSSFAAQFPDSVIDEAVNGSYQMHTIQDQVSDFQLADNSRVMMTAPIASVLPETPNAIGSASLVQETDDRAPFVRGDFDIVGSYFVGLTPQSVITVRYRVIMSTIPSSSNASLLSLAKMSPPPNTLLDELILRVQNEFLPGIPVGLNPKGEWWKIVTKSVSNVSKKMANNALQSAIDSVSSGANAVVPGSGPIVRKIGRAATNQAMSAASKRTRSRGQARTDPTKKK